MSRDGESKFFLPAAEYFSGGRAVTLDIRDYAARTGDDFHSHEFHELVLVLGGSGVHVTGEREDPIFPGDVFLIRPSCGHGYRNLKKLRIANYLYLPERLESELAALKSLLGYYVVFESDPQLTPNRRDTGHPTLTGGNFAAARELTERIRHEQQRRAPGWEPMVRWLFCEFLMLICRSFSARGSSCSEETVRIGRVLRYFEENYPRRVTLTELAKFCGCSIPSLTRLFRGAMGVGPIETLNQLRLEKAAELLRGGALPMTEIARRTGFCDSNYLSKCFRRRFSLSPRAYRNAAGNARKSAGI